MRLSQNTCRFIDLVRRVGEIRGEWIRLLTSIDKSCGLPSQYVKAPKQAPTPDSQNLGGSISIPIQRPLKRHRSRSNATASRSASNPRSRHGGPSSRTLESSASQIRVDDHRQLTEWYKDAFLRLQQVACRLVAKVWIKKIHPKKVELGEDCTLIKESR